MKTHRSWIVALLVAAYVAAPFTLLAADKKTKAKPYPLATCVVSEEKLDSMGEPHVFVFKGREVKLCCKDCQKEFEGDTAKFVRRIDEAAKKVKAYPLKTCVVSDEELGSMGDAYVFIQDGREVKLCCKDCKKEFDKAPAIHLKKIADADKKKK